MKTLLYTLFLTLGGLTTVSGQVIYVDASASGSNDGSSWANAYTTLDSALTQQASGEIWVAAGTYTPGGAMADTSATFMVNSDTDLYGGFSGTETDISQRTGSAVTILSGDILGNDNGMMDSTLRADNARHVLLVNSGIGSKITIDGFTIRGGNTSDNGGADFRQRAGGGIFAAHAVDISNCVFTNNFGRSGGGVCFDNTNSTILEPINISNVTFNNNVATSQSAGVVMFEVVDARIEDCEFSGNTTNRGTLYPADCVNVDVIDCVFTENENPTGFGGAMFVWQTQNLNIEGCQFTGNVSAQAAGMYYDAREAVLNNPSLRITDCVFSENRAASGFGGSFTMWQGTNIVIEGCEFNRNTANSGGVMLYNGTESPQFNPDNLIIRNCEFGSNESVDFGGGACYFSGASYTIDSCTFLGNISANSAGAIFSTGSNREYIIDNCFFGLNSANYGGAMTNYGENTIANISNCEFLNNTAGTGGASMNCGFKAQVNISDCSFRGGMASVGGAVSVQNDSTTVVIRNSFISGNESTNSGGGVYSFTGNTNISLYDCELVENTSNFGGAIHMGSGTDIDTSNFMASRCIIHENIATTQGGAINIINRDAQLVNCLIYGNIAESLGTGGAISHNASDTFSFELDIVNSTLSKNLGILSNGIAAWTDSVGTAIVRVQNTILDNGNDYEVEDGNPTFISAGGNFSTDAFLDILLGADDILGLDAGFVNASNFNFHLEEGSPCIDNGVEEGAPEEDLEGNMRDGMPDIGAYEYGASVSVDEISLFEDIEMSPNPARDILRLELPEHNGTSIVKVYALNGQEVLRQKLSGYTAQLNISELPEGQYLMLIFGDQYYRSTFVKM